MNYALATIPAWAWLVLSALCFAAGEYLSKKFALAPGISLILIILAVYSCGTLLWLPAIYEKNTLAVTGAIWSLLSLIATVGIGVIIFREHPSPMQWVGIVLGAVAVTLLSL